MKKYLRLAALLIATVFITSCLAIYVSAAPTGGATDDQPGYNITFTVQGEGTVHVYQTIGSVHIQDIQGGSQVTIRADKSIKFTTTPNIDLLRYVNCTEPNRDVAGDYYFMTPSRDSQVTIVFPEGSNNPGTSEPGTSEPGTSEPGTSEPGTSDPGNNSAVYTVTMEATMGGRISIGDDYAENQTRRVMMEAGNSFEYVVTANEGYEIRSLTVGGETINVTGTSYKATVNSISQSLVISAEFALIGSSEDPDNPQNPGSDTPQDGISVSDVTGWDSDHIVININEGDKVLREVLTKISQLTPGEGKYVEFASANGSIYVPFGAQFTTNSASVDLYIYKLTSGTEYNAANTKFAEAQTPFAAYKTNIVGERMPAGTLISFKTDATLANVLVNLYSVTDTIVALEQTGSAAVTNGVTEKFNYNNQPVLVCAMGDFNQHVVEMIVPAVGGNAVPGGISTVAHGEKFSFTVNAVEGHAIKQILIDGTAIEEAAGQTVYSGNIGPVEKDCTIEVTFEAVTAEGGSGGGGNTGTVILVLVIVIVALLGAAALFVVKWRQEKF